MDVLLIVACAVLLISSVYDAIMSIRAYKFQKLWDEEKDNIIRIDPAVTAQELCERYVDFCTRNNCKVDY